MNIQKNFNKFWRSFMHPRVIIFILTGTAVIFLTFLTNDNALEIAISGIASVFIGIGVNNLSSLETQFKDELQLKSKIAHSIKVMEITRSRINRIHDELNKENLIQMKDELAELEQIITLSMGLIREESTLE